MNTNIINIFGFINANNQVEIKSSQVNSKFSKKNQAYLDFPNVSEYFLSGFVAFLEAIAQTKAVENKVVLKSLQVEVVAQKQTNPELRSPQQQFFPFQKIEVALAPSTNNSIEELLQWIKEIQEYVNPPQDFVSIKLSDRITYVKAA